MEVIFGVAALLLVGWAVMKVQDKARAKANQVVFRGAHQKGQLAVARVTEFRSPVGVTQTADEIVTVVNAHTAAPTMAPGLFLAERTSSSVSFGFGNRFSEAFRLDVDFATDADGTTCGRVHCEHWREVDGLVDGVAEINRVHERVSRALASLGGSVLSAEH